MNSRWVYYNIEPHWAFNPLWHRFHNVCFMCCFATIARRRRALRYSATVRHSILNAGACGDCGGWKLWSRGIHISQFDAQACFVRVTMPHALHCPRQKSEFNRINNQLINSTQKIFMHFKKFNYFGKYSFSLYLNRFVCFWYFDIWHPLSFRVEFSLFSPFVY